jgi:glutathione S-transferase
LGRQDHRDEQLINVAELQLRLRVRIFLGKAAVKFKDVGALHDLAMKSGTTFGKRVSILHPTELALEVSIMTYALITANRNYSSWSLRPWLLMKGLGIAFEERIEPFNSHDCYAEFRAFSPTGQVPVLLDGDRTITDSLGITLYLAERHEGVWPRDEAARAWAQCAVAEMHSSFSALRGECTMNVGVRVRPRPMSDSLSANVRRIRELWEEGLACFGGPFLAGHEFSAADAFFAPVAWRIRTYGLDVGESKDWVDHIIAHPAMQEWERQALAETWREEGHEEELLTCGEVIADYRAV